MSKNNSNTSTFSIRILAYWRQRYLWRWQTSYLPRFMCQQYPRFVQQCDTTQTIITQLRLLDWEKLPPPTRKQYFGRQTTPQSAYIATYLVKLLYDIRSMGKLRHFLVTHPALVWALGFPLVADPQAAHGFSADASLPSRRQLNRVLTQLDNAILQTLLDAQVARLHSLLPASFGEVVSLDTKHVLAWVKENNPKAYIKEGRYDKTRQPAADPDCKLGCKRRHNRKIATAITPTKEGIAVNGKRVSIGEFYWGYASGAAVTKVAGWGEFVLAELTQTFDQGDIRAFFPLMAQVARRLDGKPRFGTMDAAYDAFYVYEYFHSTEHDGFAAIPLNQPNGKIRKFDQDGLPLCEAGLSMPVRKTYMDRTKSLVPHKRSFHACPLLFPQKIADSCPVAHKRWPKGGCSVQLPCSIGARLRHQLDRDGAKYKEIYAQRTAVERIFSQAVNLGIERPKLRNKRAITNHNTLIYLLINLRAIQRVLAKLQEKHN